MLRRAVEEDGELEGIALAAGRRCGEPGRGSDDCLGSAQQHEQVDAAVHGAFGDVAGLPVDRRRHDLCNVAVGGLGIRGLHDE